MTDPSVLAGLQIRYHNAMPKWAKILGLEIRAVDECEGGGFMVRKDQAEAIMSALSPSEQSSGLDEAQLREIAKQCGLNWDGLPEMDMAIRAMSRAVSVALEGGVKRITNDDLDLEHRGLEPIVEAALATPKPSAALRDGLERIVLWKHCRLGTGADRDPKLKEINDAFDRGCRMAFYRCSDEASRALTGYSCEEGVMDAKPDLG